jgi:hypothetical protein
LTKRPLADVGAAILLFALNAWIAARLFALEQSPHFNSIEGAFIGLARYLSRHFGHFSWFPIWHCGMPYQDTYVPLVHLTVALTSMWTGASAGHAYHMVTAVTYCLAPVTLYLMARMLGASRAAAFFAGLVFSVFSPSAAIFPWIGRDLPVPLSGRRLQVLTFYGEGPHVTAIAFIPIVILALENAIRKRTSRAFALAALSLALVFVTNVPGTMALGLAVFCWICIHAGEMREAWKIAGGAAALGYAVACYGVPPSALSTVFGNAGTMHSGFSHALHQTPYLLVLLLAVVGVGAFWMGRAGAPRFVSFGAAYFVLTAVLVWTARDSRNFEMLPQAGRLHLELELAASLCIGWLLWLLYRGRLTRYVVLGFGALALYYQSGNYLEGARVLLTPDDVRSHSEYTSARWIDEHLGGKRIYATGSTNFWLNAFTDTPQVVGCCDQGQSMLALSAVPYLVHAGVAPEYTKLGITWLQAMGVHAIIANGPESTDDFKNYQKPERFDGVLEELHREHGDVIYRIPQRSTSLTHVLHMGEEIAAVSTWPPSVDRYVAAIEDPTREEAQCWWSDAGHARIRTRLLRGDVLSVQVAYFSGWKARVRGESRRVRPDGIGFVVIEPECEGDCEIELAWTGRWDKWVSAVVSAVGWAIVGGFIMRNYKQIAAP